MKTPIIPKPASVERLNGNFRLQQRNRIAPPSSQLSRLATTLVERLAGRGLGSFEVVEPGAPDATIRLRLSSNGVELGEEGYELTVLPDHVEIAGSAEPGLFYGIQSLAQLLTKTEHAIPCQRIVDRPRYRWRGLHLDVARHFFGVDFIKRYLDCMAMHKLNVFHWHLTEDQGWRLPIERYPKLMEVSAWRLDGNKRYGGLYTKQEIRDVVDYARERHIRIVPEVEMPGHSLAALAAYPELSCTGGPFSVATEWGIFEDVCCAGNERTFDFLFSVLDEVVELFPGEFVHVGGDECPKQRWVECGLCQQRIRDQKLADETALQTWFVDRILRHLSDRGRRLIGWDEILEASLEKDAAVMAWRGVGLGKRAAELGHDVVTCPTTHLYFDYRQAADANEPGAAGTLLPLETVYAFEPTPDGLEGDARERILGVQGNVWTEHMPTPQRVEYMVLPRACALAEVAWSPGSTRDFGDFQARLVRHLEELAAFGYRFRPVSVHEKVAPAPVLGSTAVGL